MSTMTFGDFEWDEEKALENFEKHGVTFEEGTSVFSDVDYVLISDSADSSRYLALGYSSLARMFVVVHCERGERIRIISVRKATRTERKSYG